MIEWIKCSDSLPKSKRYSQMVYATDENYPILVSINGKSFIGSAQTFNFGSIIFDKEFIIYDISRRLWILPKHFKEPDYWLEIPELPHD